MKATLAAALHHHPGKKLFVIGITGTDGKTTTCHLVYHFLQHAGIKAVFAGTTGAKINNKEIEGIEKMTSYDPMDLQSLLDVAVKGWCTHAVLETSSHGLTQYRFKSIPFHVAVLTNITAEHLDYHKTIDQYAASKQKLFRELQKQGKKWTAVLPLDDAYGRRRSERMHFGTMYGFWFTSNAQFQGTHIREHINYTTFTLNYMGQSYTVQSPLLGRFNVQNVLAAFAAWHASGLSIETMIESLKSYVHAPGRQRHIELWWINRYIDYAHTPNGLEMMLSYLQSIKNEWRVICLFGAPGLRDRMKRPEMGKVVDRLSDIVILTDDDPSTEDRRQILSDILAGIPREEWPTFAILPERRHAIAHACLIAKPWDVVLFAGIGHQQCLYTNAGRIDRDEERVLREEWEKINKKQ